MKLRLDITRWFNLLYWGRDQNCTTPNRTAALLCDVVLELCELPENAPPSPSKGNRLGPGEMYPYAVDLNQRTKRIRALWAWGQARGASSISEAFRHLVDLMVEAYPDLETPRIGELRPECLFKLAELVESTDADPLKVRPTQA